jgi:hypothetical protein
MKYHTLIFDTGAHDFATGTNFTELPFISAVLLSTLIMVKKTEYPKTLE